VTQSTFSDRPEDTAASVKDVDGMLRLKPPTQNIRAFPHVSLGGDRKLEYLGTFCADANYSGAAIEVTVSLAMSN
jgi:hypothetical protein